MGSREFGLKIKNFEAGSLYSYNNGVRDHYDYKNAMLTNSLFLDFLLSNGLAIWHENATRDIIGISFSYGSRSSEEEIKHLSKTIEKYEKIKKQDIADKLNVLLNNIETNYNKFDKKTKEELREIFYQNGVDVVYETKNKQGVVKKMETIHYKMLFRSTGKAKKGSCVFIRDELYDAALKFLRMGIKLPETNAPIVEIGAYSSLVASTIIEKIKINPKNILIIKDIDSCFDTKVVSVETNEKRECVAKHIDNYTVKNTLFDGQALIDSSIFPSDCDGYVLLRHHFCKMAAFKTNIQTFFKDYFGEKYLTATVQDIFGNNHFVKDIELITTENAMKWLKMDVSYDYWCDRVFENDCMFGIVKTSHKSKLGDVQRMSYQMINALDIDMISDVAKCSVDYIDKLKSDDDTFLEYLKLLSKSDGFCSDYEILLKLVEQNPDFLRCEYFKERKRKIIETYVVNFRSGRCVQNADNLVIVGSPFAMLLASVNEDVKNDDTLQCEENTIQCFTQRFQDGEYLAEFRSPFNSKNNMGYLHNVYHSKMFKYFDFGEQIIAINMIGTDFQDRNNGLTHWAS